MGRLCAIRMFESSESKVQILNLMDALTLPKRSSRRIQWIQFTERHVWEACLNDISKPHVSDRYVWLDELFQFKRNTVERRPVDTLVGTLLLGSHLLSSHLSYCNGYIMHTLTISYCQWGCLERQFVHPNNTVTYSSTIRSLDSRPRFAVQSSSSLLK